MRQRIAALRIGEWEPGLHRSAIPPGKEGLIPIKVKVTIKGERLSTISPAAIRPCGSIYIPPSVRILGCRRRDKTFFRICR